METVEPQYGFPAHRDAPHNHDQRWGVNENISPIFIGPINSFNPKLSVQINPCVSVSMMGTYKMIQTIFGNSLVPVPGFKSFEQWFEKCWPKFIINVMKTKNAWPLFIWWQILLSFDSGQGSLLLPFIYYRFLTLRYTSRRNPYCR